MNRRKFLTKMVILGSLLTPLFGHAQSETQERKPIRLAQPNLEQKILSVIDDNNPQDIMFGDYHEGLVRDSEFLISLLPELEKRGYNYLALEIQKNPTKKIEKYFKSYAERNISRKNIPKRNMQLIEKCGTGWFDLIDAAKKQKIICYDVDGSNLSFTARDKKSLENLHSDIYSKNPNAKVVYFCGAAHVLNQPVYQAIGEYIPIRRHENIRKVEPLEPLAYQLKESGRDVLSFVFDIQLNYLIKNSNKSTVHTLVSSSLKQANLPSFYDYVISP